MAVRADDIALGGLGKDPGQAGSPDKRGKPRRLRRRISVIKVHRALGESSATVRTWDRPQLIKDICLIAPSEALFFDSRRHGWRPRCKPLPVTASTSQAVAVRADDVALRCLGEDLLATLESGSSRAERECLLGGISVIEVHLVACEPTSAVGARDFPELAQKRGRGFLALPHPLDLGLPIGQVVGDVLGSLVSRTAHGLV